MCCFKCVHYKQVLGGEEATCSPGPQPVHSEITTAATFDVDHCEEQFDHSLPDVQAKRFHKEERKTEDVIRVNLYVQVVHNDYVQCTHHDQCNV